jgi:hypothetical protein
VKHTLVIYFYFRLLANIRLGCEGLLGTNTLAYFAPPSVTKKKNQNLDARSTEDMLSYMKESHGDWFATEHNSEEVCH